jgi:hypothetical protein
MQSFHQNYTPIFKVQGVKKRSADEEESSALFDCSTNQGLKEPSRLTAHSQFTVLGTDEVSLCQ